jgi:hypothetical protein
MNLRINIQGRLLKPIAPAIQTKLSAAQGFINDMKSYARKINEGLPNEEYSIRTDYDNQAVWVDFNIDLAIPENQTGTLILNTGTSKGIKVASVVVPKLVTLRNAVRDFKQYLTNNDNGSLQTEVFICHHDNPSRKTPDEPRLEI